MDHIYIERESSTWFMHVIKMDHIYIYIYIIKGHRLLILDYVTSVVGVCSLMGVTLLHGHAEEANCC